MSRLAYKLSLAFLLGMLIATLVVLLQKPWQAYGSNPVGNDYTSTSTRSVTGSNNLSAVTVLKATGGTLARVTITGANTGIIRFWDATTTNVNFRASGAATSTLNFVDITASLAAGTYDYDVDFKNGIIYELVGGTTAPTSTIMYR